MAFFQGGGGRWIEFNVLAFLIAWNSFIVLKTASNCCLKSVMRSLFINIKLLLYI